MIDWDDYDNFSAIEFACHCGCGRADMDAEFMSVLQTFRVQLNFPFRISSGFRCPAYNDRVSTTGLTGPHTTGKACDVLAYHKHAGKIIDNMRGCGFKGLGVSQKGEHAKRFLHLDMARDEFRLWSY